MRSDNFLQGPFRLSSVAKPEDGFAPRTAMGQAMIEHPTLRARLSHPPTNEPNPRSVNLGILSRHNQSPDHRLSLWRHSDLILHEAFKPVPQQNRRARLIEPNVAAIGHFNDVYLYFSESGSDPSRFAHLLRSVEYYAGGYMLQTSGGDVLGGSALGRYFQGQQSIDIMHEIGTHYAVPGNHEFDEDAALAEAKFSDSRFRWLLANMFNSNDQDLYGTIRSHIKEINGIKFGMIGLAGDWRKEASGSMDFKWGKFEAHVPRLVAQLRKQGAEVIVALTHQDIEYDRLLAKYFTDIDIIVGGHDHLPYAEYDDVNRTVILKSGMNWSHMGLALVHKQPNGHIYAQFGNIPVNGELPRDPRVFSIAKGYQDKFDFENSGRRNEVLSKSVTSIDTRSTECRQVETSGGNLLADAFREFGRYQLLENRDHNSKMFEESGDIEIHSEDIVAITNGGGIRSNKVFPAGDFTVGDSEDMLPFPNRVVLMPLKGSAIWQALEDSVSRVEHIDGGFPQISGIRFVWDPYVTRDELKAGRRRVRSVEIHGQPLDLDKMYYVVSNDFLSRGGNDYRAFLTATQHDVKPRAFAQTMHDVLVWYLRRMDVLDPKVEGRIVRLEDAHDDFGALRQVS